jgi:aspartate aminotransferase
MAVSLDQLAKPCVSSTLAANELINQMRTDGIDIAHMAFGQAPFPAPQRLVNALRDHAGEKGYMPIAGLPELRQAVADHHALHTNVDMSSYDVVIGPGSKVMLFALQMAIPGDLLMPIPTWPIPTWVSYEPQAKLLGQRVIPVPTNVSDAGYTIDAAAIDRALTEARSAGLNPTKLLINFPNNPTGLSIEDDTMSALVDICRKRDLVLISDEIYGRLSYDHSYRSAASAYPEGAVVTTGISKHLSLGGWRLGICLVPKAIDGLFEHICHIASETWSCVAAPIQVAAIHAYVGHSDIEQFIRDTTDIHALVNGYVATSLRSMGADCPTPQGAFYTWPDFGNVLSGSYHSSDQLARTLLEKYKVATLCGRVFGERPEVLKLRLSACDYDGEKALAIWNASNGSDDMHRKIEKIAPNVVTAMRSFESMIGDHMAG